jgi:hypothetical protein
VNRCRPEIHANRPRPRDGPARTHPLTRSLQLAVLNNVLATNPVRDVQTIRSKLAPKRAPALTAEQVRDLLAKLRTPEACQQRDRNTLQHSRVTGDGL